MTIRTFIDHLAALEPAGMTWQPETMDVSAEMWEHLVKAGTEVQFCPGDVVLRQGDPPSHVVLLLTGRVKVLLHLSDGKILLLAVRGSSEVLGVMGVISGGDRSATVIAVDACNTRVLPAERFLVLLHSAGEESVLLRRAMSRIREGEAWRAEMAVLPARLRVARALLRLALPSPDEPLGVNLNQSEIGYAVGLSRSAVAAELARLREAQIITTAERGVMITDLRALRALAASGHDGV